MNDPKPPEPNLLAYVIRNYQLGFLDDRDFLVIAHDPRPYFVLNYFCGRKGVPIVS